MSLVPLSEVCDITAGQSAPQDSDAFGPEGHPFIRAGSLEALTNGGSENDCEHLTEKKAQQYRMRLFPKDTIVFAKSGMSAKIGRVYRLKAPAYIVSHLAAVTPGEDVDPSYLQRWFERNPPSRLIPNEAYPSIRTSEIGALKIELPKKIEQKRIADILDKADAIRRKRQQAIQLADEFLRSVFLDMFGDPSSNPNNWKTAPIKCSGKVVTGNTPSRKQPEYYGDHIEWIKSDNINTPSHYLTPASEYLSESGRAVARTAPAGSILVTCIAGSRDCIGNVALADREVAFNQQINAIIPNDNVNKWFLYGQILFAKTLIQSASTNSMKGMVSKSKFEQIEVLNPPERLQYKFGEIFQKHSELTDNLRTLYGKSQETFSSISQRAFRGDLI